MKAQGIGPLGAAAQKGARGEETRRESQVRVSPGEICIMPRMSSFNLFRTKDDMRYSGFVMSLILKLCGVFGERKIHVFGGI